MNPSNTSVQHYNVQMPSSSSIRTNSYFTPTSQIPTNTNSLQTHTSHSNFHITHPYAQPSHTVSNPTYINSSTPISEPINHLMVLIINIHLKNIYNTLKLVLHFLQDYNLQPFMNINFGTLDEWFFNNALLLVQLLAGTFA